MHVGNVHEQPESLIVAELVLEIDLTRQNQDVCSVLVQQCHGLILDEICLCVSQGRIPFMLRYGIRYIMIFTVKTIWRWIT